MFILKLHNQQYEDYQKYYDIELFCEIRAASSNSLNNKRYNQQINRSVVLPKGKPRILHLLRCQGIAVNDYNFNLGRLEATASSTFATSGCKQHFLDSPNSEFIRLRSSSFRLRSSSYDGTRRPDKSLRRGTKERISLIFH